MGAKIKEIIDELERLKNRLWFYQDSMSREELDEVKDRIKEIVNELEEIGVTDRSAPIDLDEWKRKD